MTDTREPAGPDAASDADPNGPEAAPSAVPGEPTNARAGEQQGPAGVPGLVATVDRLRSPGGCPWDGEQTHETLAKFAVEEAYELADAIASGRRDDIVDELGDVLYQVVFHARVGQERTEEAGGPFDLDEIADRIVAKLHRRHPHVFGDVVTDSQEVIEANWDAIKAAENPDRTSPLDGIPASLAPLERATKIATRYRRAGRLGEVHAATAHTSPAHSVPAHTASAVDGRSYGARLFDLVLEAVDAGVDPSTELLGHVRLVSHTLRE